MPVKAAAANTLFVPVADFYAATHIRLHCGVEDVENDAMEPLAPAYSSVRAAMLNSASRAGGSPCQAWRRQPKEHDDALVATFALP